MSKPIEDLERGGINRHGLRRQSETATALFERTGSVEVSNSRGADESGVALRWPPQSKTSLLFPSLTTGLDLVGGLDDPLDLITSPSERGG
jgi:hypothetical protein